MEMRRRDTFLCNKLLSINEDLAHKEIIHLTNVGDILTASSMKITIFWDVEQCSLVEFYRRFRSTCCLHHRSKTNVDDLNNIGKVKDEKK
jgi:hypothetical protein